MIFYQQHIMWYELEILKENLDSLYAALQHSLIPIHIGFGINWQTYLEEPIENISEVWAKSKIKEHPIFKEKNVEIWHFYDGDGELFYNIGDWRREEYKTDAKYTVWGETDCLIPEDYFYILSNLDIKEPHILSLSSRIMWDASWKPVIHVAFQESPFVDNQKPNYDYLYPYRYFDVINQDQLNEFNNQFEIEIIKLNDQKIDGALLALSGGLPRPFIAPDMNFVREDTCAEHFFRKKGIPQYHITTRMKGHNYYHPNKRTNTLNTRDEEAWKIMEAKQTQTMIKFLNEC